MREVIDAETVAQGVLDRRLQAAIEHAWQVVCETAGEKPQLVADQADDRGDVARAFGHGVGDQRTETDVIAADRKQHDTSMARLRPSGGHHCLVMTCSLMLVLPEL